MTAITNIDPGRSASSDDEDGTHGRIGRLQERLDTLLAREQRWRRALDRLPDSIVLLDAHNRVQYVNDAAQTVLISPRKAALAPLFDDILPKDASEALHQAKAAVARKGVGYLSVELTQTDDSTVHLEIRLIDLGAGECLAVARDVTAWVETEARLTAAATHDALTGLLNRGASQNRAIAEVSRARRGEQALGLLLLDVDELKAVNDLYGHADGDAVLQHVAQSIEDNLRPYDWSGRWGGDEFLVVLPGTDAAQALAIAERLRAAITGTPPAQARERLHLTVSIGLTHVVAGVDKPLDVIVREADQALLDAKHRGRDQVRAYAAAGGS